MHMVFLFRGNWRIVRRNLNNQRVIAVVSTDHNLINSDENEVYTSRCMMCCRVFAIIVISLSLSLSTYTHVCIHVHSHTVKSLLTIIRVQALETASVYNG